MNSAEKSRRYRERHPGIAYETQKRWRQNHPELYRETENAYRRERYAEDDEYAANARDKARAQEARLGGFTPPPLEADCPPMPTDGHCQRCGAPADRLLLDHDHDTGEFRGWVCDRCNIETGERW